MLETIKQFFTGLFDTRAEKTIKRALRCKTLAELITLQQIVILKYQRNSTRFAGKRLTVIEYLRRSLGSEIIAPRIAVTFCPVPMDSPREFPMYAIYILVNGNTYDTQLLATIEEGMSYPVIVHKSEHFGLLEPAT